LEMLRRKPRIKTNAAPPRAQAMGCRKKAG